MLTRIAVMPPFIMDYMERRGILARYPWISAPFQVAFCGLCLTFTTPLFCALFPQLSSIEIASLEPELQQVVANMKNSPQIGFYNKGL